MIPSTTLIHTAFYAFAHLADPDVVVTRLRELTVALTGSILVASEGINGVLAGPEGDVAAFEQAVVSDPLFEGAFARMTFKHSACTTAPFFRMKVHKKAKIVAVGLPTAFDEPGACSLHGGTVLSPQEWRELIAQEDVVVIDNRNSFEFRLGRFKNALDPEVANFRDFPKFIAARADQWRAEGKKVAMYCTGGIRCEKTGPWMNDLGLDVYQLEGGILNYFQALPDAALDWEGECFVFDNRIALDTHLAETSTTLEEVYAAEPDCEWRIARARRLAQKVN